MNATIHLSDKYDIKKDTLFICREKSDLLKILISPEEKAFLIKKFDSGENALVDINQYERHYYFLILNTKEKKEFYLILEDIRRLGYSVCASLNKNKIKEIQVVDKIENSDFIKAFIEGLVLSNYQFLKYFKTKEKKQNSLDKIKLISKAFSKNQLEELATVLNSISIVKDLVNEPVSYLNAEKLGHEIVKLSKDAGFKAEVFNKKKIETLKMGGLLAVNKGSIDEPTFSILEWKPKNALNKKPFVLVGKGVVYDTGGLSLKPTKGSMDEMKCDMAGAGVVIGTLYSIAKNKLPIYVVGLIPATDNRPGGNAYAPGDVITMYNGSTVEVLNTDAEGRIILADALTYAQRYNPELVLDFATLTGSAQKAIGNFASVVMGTAERKDFKLLEDIGYNVFERIVEFPFWSEYGDMMKSNIADLKNIGSDLAGAITAGKFLECFTLNEKDKQAYPWIHLDIAGPAFLSGTDNYRGNGGTAYGVRLTYEFLKSKIIKKK